LLARFDAVMKRTQRRKVALVVVSVVTYMMTVGCDSRTASTAVDMSALMSVTSQYPTASCLPVRWKTLLTRAAFPSWHQ
jgi:hypothetical protein